MVPRRLRLVFAYDAAGGMDMSVVYGGLCNQIYSHVGMLALAVQLGAEVVRLPACEIEAAGLCTAMPDENIREHLCFVQDPVVSALDMLPCSATEGQNVMRLCTN